MHIFRQEETLCQALGNPPTFTLRPRFDAQCYWMGLITEPEGGLAAHFWSREGRNMRTNLGNWPSIIDKLSDCDPAKYSGRWGPRGSVTRVPQLLLDSTLPFSCAAKSWVSALGLLLLLCRMGAR